MFLILLKGQFNADYSRQVITFTKKIIMIRKDLLFLTVSILFSCHLTAQNFTQSEKNQILAVDTAKMMRILVYNDPSDLMILNSQSIDIDPADPLLP